jgi:hypothetical protein
VFDTDVPVVSLDHLRKMKLKAGGPQDIADVEALTNWRCSIGEK